MTDDSPPPTKPQRRSPAELLHLCPRVFEGLSKEKIEDRWELFRLRGVSDPFDGLEELLADTKEPEPVGDVALQPILDLLLPLLWSLCRQHGQEAIAEDAQRRVNAILDCAGTGSTRGEQRAAMRLRHPFLTVPPAYRPADPSDPSSDMFRPLPPDGRKVGKLLIDPLRAIRLRREFSTIRQQMKDLIPDTKEQRQARQQELFEVLRARCPALQPALQSKADVIDLTPGKAARIVFGAMHRVSPSQVDNMLAEAKDVIVAWDDPGAAARGYFAKEAEAWISDPDPGKRAYAKAYLAKHGRDPEES